MGQTGFVYCIRGKPSDLTIRRTNKKIRTKHSTVVSGSTFCSTPHLLEEEKGTGGPAVDIPMLHHLRIIRIEKLDEHPPAPVLSDLWDEDEHSRLGRGDLYYRMGRFSREGGRERCNYNFNYNCNSFRALVAIEDILADGDRENV